MTTRDKWKRIQGYGRAAHRTVECYRGESRLHLRIALKHERHAWGRLPRNLKALIQEPEQA